MLQQHEMYKVDPVTRLLSDSVPQYDTVRWTERYFDWGDFEMTFTLDIPKIMALLPVGSIVTHLYTTSAMWVSTHSIETDENKNTILTISGKSVDSFLDYRITAPWSAQVLSASWTAIDIRAAGRKSWTNPPALPSVPAGITADNTGQMPDRAYLVGGTTYASIATTIMHTFLDPGREPHSSIANLVINNGAVGSTALTSYYCPPGQLGPAVRALTNADDIGIRYKRTQPTDVAGSTILELYTGIDRHLSTVFREDMGFFKKISYLKTEEGAAHETHLFTDLYRMYLASPYLPATGPDSVAGMPDIRRRQLRVDDDTVKWLDISTNSALLRSSLTAISQNALRAGIPKLVFEVSIEDQLIASGNSQTDSLKFGLGDLITFYTSYAGSQIMRHTEQTLVWDRGVGAVQYLPAFELVG